MSSFHQAPPLRPEGVKSNEPRSWIEEYLEGKDELMLYITASLGIILPGFVYFLYHKCHAYYLKYAKKKEEERLAEEAAQSETSIFVLGGNEGPAAKWAKFLNDRLSNEMVNKPQIWLADNLPFKDIAQFKGFLIVVVENLAGGVGSPSTDLLLEWLEDVAADSRQRKKMNFEKIRFAVVSFGSFADGERNFDKVGRTVLKRLRILNAKEMIEIECFDVETEEEVLNSRFEIYVDDLLNAMDRNLPGAEETETEESSEDEEYFEVKKKQ